MGDLGTETAWKQPKLQYIGPILGVQSDTSKFE